MSSKAKPKGPLYDHPSFEVSLWPYRTGAVVEVGVGFSDGTGRHRSRIAYWHVDLTRGQLAGRTSDDVLRLLCDCLVRRLESGTEDPADYTVGRENRSRRSPGAPGGATGATVTQDCLPGLQPTLDTPGGVDTL